MIRLIGWAVRVGEDLWDDGDGNRYNLLHYPEERHIFSNKADAFTHMHGWKSHGVHPVKVYRIYRVKKNVES